jgi:hypothetical protein
MIKAQKKQGIKLSHPNIIKSMFDRLIANITLNAKKLKGLPLKLRMRKECPISPFLFCIVLEFSEQ